MKDLRKAEEEEKWREQANNRETKVAIQQNDKGTASPL